MMSQLVAELKLEHREIVQTLEEVNRLGIGTKEGQDKLLSVKYNLLAHLDKEDKKMYPKLSKAAENDQNLRQTLGFYTTNTKEIYDTALQFFSKYSHGGSGYEFGNDFGKLYTTLSLRIAKEEAILYKLFEELELSQEQQLPRNINKIPLNLYLRFCPYPVSQAFSSFPIRVLSSDLSEPKLLYWL